ncbi:hypothetical protein BHE74_00020112, partial [Ensete ventricosum]
VVIYRFWSCFFRDRSVVGLNFDFLVLNMTKHSSYLVYNAAMFFSPVIKRQYHEKYGFGEVGIFSVTIQVIMTAIKYIPQEVVLFDILFIFQHYVLYPVKNEVNPTIMEENIAPLINSEEKPQLANV